MDFDRLRRNWENLGRRDPMWAVLTRAGTEGGRWDEREFYATGDEFVAWLGSWLGLHGIDVPKGPALDFGCGAGRLTFALAPHFETVTGVDVSQPMIDFAAARCRHDNVRLVCNPREDLSRFESGAFAFVLTAIVLQHMRRDYQLRYLVEFLRVLRPGGLLFFQTATEQVAPHDFVAPEKEPEGEASMEIHCVPRDELLRTLAANGGELLRDEPDLWAGDKWRSVHCAVRRAP